MQSPTDAQLLAEYAANRSEVAFAQLVNRYVALVHSAARRQVGDPEAAEEITQAVFITLARKARHLSGRTVLSGWLCRTAYFTARDFLKADRRRQQREQVAAMNALEESTNEVWKQLAPVLDEAVAQLREVERDAIVLRFYEQRSLDEVGAALGVGADAAQKRVARALEKLRDIFARRGVSLSETALGGALATSAIQAVPVGLPASISAAALVAGKSVAVSTAVLMTTFQKAVLCLAFATAVGVGIYQARQVSRAQWEVQTLRRQQQPLAEEVQQLTRARDDAVRELAILQEENERLSGNTPELMRLRAKVAQLGKQPGEAGQPGGPAASVPIPVKAPTDRAEFERVKSQLLNALGRVSSGLREFMTNDPLGQILDSTGQINPSIFSNSPALPLDRFEITIHDAQHLAAAIERHPKLIIAKSKEPIEFDGYYTHCYLLADGTTTATTLGVADEPVKDGYVVPDSELRKLAETTDPVRRVLRHALEAFAAANNGRKPTSPSELKPFITTPEQQAAFEKSFGIERPAGRN